MAKTICSNFAISTSTATPPAPGSPRQRRRLGKPKQKQESANKTFPAYAFITFLPHTGADVRVWQCKLFLSLLGSSWPGWRANPEKSGELLAGTFRTAARINYSKHVFPGYLCVCISDCLPLTARCPTFHVPRLSFLVSLSRLWHS